ncbi:hypothetical protein CRX72_02180 [Pantoea sp. BRM17]|nr:hypothetical protein CRX72_02180 [Pantoea sp. BRM17]
MWCCSQRFDGVTEESRYEDCITLRIALPHAQIAAFKQNLSDYSRGALALLPLDN